MAVAANICVAWPSTAASIPAGWTRETALDARYILGAAAGADTDLSTDRGNTTHSHTSPSHTPLQNSHTHNIDTDTDGSSQLGGPPPNGGSAAATNHTHGTFTSNAATATNNGIAITVNATSNDLAYTEVIWIKSDGTPLTLPTGCYAFFSSDTLPPGWSRVKGDRYLKGAAAASSPAADGGANTHTHTSPAHTHTQDTHSHAATTSSGGDFSLADGAGTQTNVSSGHTHAITLLATTPTNQSVTTTINSGNHEPPYSQLNTILASAPDLPTNVIALWLSTNASIPTGWTRYTAMDGKWLKNAAANGDSGTTGGASQHLHTASDCQPTQDAHFHTGSDPGSSGTTTGTQATGLNSLSQPGHTHNWEGDSQVATNIAIAVTIDNCTADAALPKHRTVIYVQFGGAAPPTPSRGGVWTSYNIGRFDVSEPVNMIPQEAAKRIAQGDLRYIPNRS